MQLENWQYAIDAYSDILKQQPSNQIALYFRAYLYDKTNRLNLSRTDYEALLKANPNHFEGRLAELLLQLNCLLIALSIDKRHFLKTIKAKLHI